MKIEQAYQFGYDAGMNGPNKNNCHYSIFLSGELSAAWSKGNQDAKRLKRLEADEKIKNPNEQTNSN